MRTGGLTMNNDITTEQQRLMRHALGLDQSPRAYRNHYSANTEDAAWEDLVRKGLAFKEPRGTGVLYGVSVDGLLLIGIYKYAPYCEYDHTQQQEILGAFVCKECGTVYCHDCHQLAGGVCTEHEAPKLIRLGRAQ
jgi:hypothetical protein